MKYLLLLLALTLTGCNTPVTDEDMKDIHYMQDKRTGLCFAYTFVAAGKAKSITLVPCDKVTALIENGWSR